MVAEDRSGRRQGVAQELLHGLALAGRRGEPRVVARERRHGDREAAHAHAGQGAGRPEEPDRLLRPEGHAAGPQRTAHERERRKVAAVARVADALDDVLSLLPIPPEEAPAREFHGPLHVDQYQACKSTCC